MKTQVYKVKGMHCASCSNIITKKLKKLPGIDSVDVNFATEKANLTIDPLKISTDRMNKEINKLGYSLIEPDLVAVSESGIEIRSLADEKIKPLKSLRTKLTLVLPPTFFVFFLMMWDIGSKLSSLIPDLPFSMELYNTVLFIMASLVLLTIGKTYLIALGRFIKYRTANMDTLVGIGTLTAYVYSSVLFLFPSVMKEFDLPSHMYFDVTIVVIGFITLGKYLEAKSKLKTGEAIEKLLSLQAKTAIIEKGGSELEIPVSDVLIGDMVIVKPGGKIPVDGVIIEGSSTVDESMISGESVFVDKKKGDAVIGASINKQGIIKYSATKVGKDTMLSQIISFVEKAQGSKAQIQNLADKISSVFVPTVLISALFSFIIWLTVGTYFLGFSQAFSFGLLAFVGILVIACPCALGLATPTAIVTGVGKGAMNGILIKNAESLEKLYRVNTIVFDKTGTITSGKPQVTDIIPIDHIVSSNKLMQYAYSIESNSEHPLALAINLKGQKMKLKKLKIEKFKENEGIGVEGVIENKRVVIRKPQGSESEISEIRTLQSQGKTVIVIEIEKSIKGIIAISDTIKESTRAVVEKLSKLKLRTILLTGDNKKAANYIARKAGMNEVIAEVLPTDKARMIKSLQEKGFVVAMVGDGINDAPALTSADVGIAMATGSDIAIDSADITLLSGDIRKVPQSIKLSRLTMRTIKQNLFWAFIYNIIGIPLAAGLFYPILGIFLNPMFAGLAMAFSSVSVVTNSLLLKRRKL